MWTYNSPNFINGNIFCFNESTCNWSTALFCSDVWHCDYTIAMYNNCLNPTSHVFWGSAVGSTLDLESKGCLFEPTVRHYFSSNNVRLLASPSLQVKIYNQNEWSVTNQIAYTVSGKILIFSLFVGCFYHKGVALMMFSFIMLLT